MKWRFKGDMVSKEFFKAVQEQPTSTALTSFMDDTGQVIHNRPSLEQLCMDFYSMLYQAQSPSEANEAKKYDILQLVQPRFNLEAVHCLNQPLFLTKL